ncbi:MAG: GFA family protein [Filomicrobium sp.]
MTAERTEVEGHCLCGAISYSATLKAPEMAVCHCDMCLRWAGGPFFGVDCAEAPKITGEENLSVYQSSDWGERCFCGKCGTVLFWRMRDGSHHSANAAALKSTEGLRFTHEIFVDEKPGYYDFANETKKLTAAEVIAMFTGSAEQN